MVKRGDRMGDGFRHEGDGISISRIGRAAPLAGVIARTSAETLFASLKGKTFGPDDYARQAERYVHVLGHSKGALMKAGQMLSVVPMISTAVPERRAALQEAMARLQSAAPPMPPQLAADIIGNELGQAPEEVFGEFSPAPIAAASIGQVHVARLYDGRAVAVKVQYPGVAEALRADLRNTELVAVFLQFLRSVVPGLARIDLKSAAAEVSARITEELDYRAEASHQVEFADAYRGHPFIRIPEVVTQFSTGKVLTQELAEGLSWTDALTASQTLRNAWGEAIYRFAHGSLRRLGVFNADPHPGNYVFHPDGTVSFLDFGCVKRFSSERVAQVRAVYRAGLRQDADLLWQTLIEIGLFDPERAPTPQEVLEHYNVRLEMALGPQPFTLTPESMARVIAHEFTLTGSSGRFMRSVQVPHDWVFYSRLDLGINSVLAELRCTQECRAIAEEMDEGGPPATPYGEADLAFWAAQSCTA